MIDFKKIAKRLDRSKRKEDGVWLEDGWFLAVGDDYHQARGKIVHFLDVRHGMKEIDSWEGCSLVGIEKHRWENLKKLGLILQTLF